MYHLEHQKIQIPSWLHSTFKDLSNEYSHAQIRAKTKKLWLRQVGEKKIGCCLEVCRDMGSMSRQAVCRDRCRDKQQYVATDVATSSSMSRPMSRQAAVCRDKQALSRPECCRNLKKKLKFDILIKFQAHFTLRPYIYSFFR